MLRGSASSTAPSSCLFLDLGGLTAGLHVAYFLPATDLLVLGWRY